MFQEAQTMVDQMSASVSDWITATAAANGIPTSGGGTDNAGATARFGYSASNLDTSTYSMTGLSYPEDLMTSNNYGGNRVVFYINVSVDSRVLRGGNVPVVTGVTRDMRSQLLGQNITGAQAAAAMGIGGAVAGTVIGGALGGGSGYGGGGALGAALGVAGAGVFGFNANTGDVQEGQQKEPTFTRPQKRLKSAIALYIPNQLNVRYSTQWGEVDTAAFGAIAKGGEELGRGLEASPTRSSGLVGEVLGAAAINVAPGGQVAGVLTGLAANPKKEQAFQQVDFRTFSFDYQFAPKSETEAQNVLNIIRTFKYHMHPEFKSQDAFLYIYPSEFDITYYHQEKENLNIHRHTSCVLTDMNVNYTPNGVFTTFPNGMPTQINVTMTFKELMLLSKETIEKYT